MAGLELFFLGTQVDPKRRCLELLIRQVIKKIEEIKGLICFKNDIFFKAYKTFRN